jgi:hypothetical protein
MTLINCTAGFDLCMSNSTIRSDFNSWYQLKVVATKLLAQIVMIQMI